jgi:hypothetical protein
MSSPPVTPEDQYATVVAALIGEPDVALGSQGKQRFGGSTLQVHGKIFAMLVGGAFVVKLPRARVDALVAAGEGERFVGGHGRAMKEWVTVDAAAGERWLLLAREALAFVGQSAKR